MAKVLILGGGFAGVVAAQQLARELGDEHQITLVSRSRKFIFYPALVRLAFGKCELSDVSFDVRRSMLNRRVNFVEGEVARICPDEQKVIIAHGEVEGDLTYDYLIFALGRRLATERITGFYEHAHHLLTVEKALEFGKAVTSFAGGRIVVGECPGARMPVPVYETAFALSQLLHDSDRHEPYHITVVSPDSPGKQLDDSNVGNALLSTLNARGIEFLSDFPIDRVTAGAATTSNGHGINFDLLMLVPPFAGAPAASHLGITNAESYINVDSTMRVNGLDRVYAAGDCVNFSGPKLGHMAVRQAEVAAANLIAEINGLQPTSRYIHEVKVVIDASGSDSLYIHKDLWTDEPASFYQGRFWTWAKLAQEKYWETMHS